MASPSSRSPRSATQPWWLSAIITALGVREAGDEPLIERLKAVLRDKRLLLVLDNFEQVVEAAPIVADLLGDLSRRDDAGHQPRPPPGLRGARGPDRPARSR